MSTQGIFKNIKERLWKPSEKRQKLGEEEDDWCDALNYLSLDCDDEYFDAPEQQVTSISLPKKSKELPENKFEKKSEMHQPQIRSYTAPSTPGVRSRRTYGETSEERQRQIFPRPLHSGDLQFGMKDSWTSSTMKTDQYRFAAGGSNTATSSSSEAGVQDGFKRSTSIHDPHQEHPMKGYIGGISDHNLEKLTKALMGEVNSARSLGRELGFSLTDVYGYCGYGGISDSNLEKLAKDLMGDDYHSLGQKLGFSRTDVDRYCGYGKQKGSSGILRMLRAWKDKTPYAKQISGLLEALRKANLRHLADDLDLQKDLTSLAPLPRAGDRAGGPPTIEINPEQPATTDEKSGKSCQEENRHSDKSSGWLGWLGHIGCWLRNWFVWFTLFGWLQWLRLRARPTRKPRIYLCTSSGIWSIRGLKEKLKTLSDTTRCVVQDLELPYNRLEQFKFPPEVYSTDAMILCHSVENRGFSITDVQDSIYDEFLKYCNQVIGKDHMVVVVHDFGFNKEALKGHVETFQSRQPMTFKMAGIVVFAGKLDDTEVQLCQDDLTQLEQFVKKFC